MTTPADITQRLIAEAHSGELAEFCATIGVDLLVLHGSAVYDAAHAGDVDVAYSVDFELPKQNRPTILDVATEFLSRYGEGIDVMNLNAAGVVARHRALTDCLLLVDTTNHKFGDMQASAAGEYINTQHRRDLEWESLSR